MLVARDNPYLSRGCRSRQPHWGQSLEVGWVSKPWMDEARGLNVCSVSHWWDKSSSHKAKDCANQRQKLPLLSVLGSFYLIASFLMRSWLVFTRVSRLHFPLCFLKMSDQHKCWFRPGFCYRGPPWTSSVTHLGSQGPSLRESFDGCCQDCFQKKILLMVEFSMFSPVSEDRQNS